MGGCLLRAAEMGDNVMTEKLIGVLFNISAFIYFQNSE